jgi:hypothetical protein
MKKQVSVVILLLIAFVIKAQEPPKPPTIEERLKKTNEILQKEVQLNTSQQKEVEAAYKNFFEGIDKLHKENPPPPPPPPDPKIKEAMDKLVKERDAKIEKILTPEQFKKYQEAAQKLHPPKPAGNKPPPTLAN